MPQSFLGENGNYLKRLFLSQIKKIIDKIVACYGVKTMNIKQIPVCYYGTRGITIIIMWRELVRGRGYPAPIVPQSSIRIRVTMLCSMVYGLDALKVVPLVPVMTPQ